MLVCPAAHESNLECKDIPLNSAGLPAGRYVVEAVEYEREVQRSDRSSPAAKATYP